jgi:hypothetical protein
VAGKRKLKEYVVDLESFTVEARDHDEAVEATQRKLKQMMAEGKVGIDAVVELSDG